MQSYYREGKCEGFESCLFCRAGFSHGLFSFLCYGCHLQFVPAVLSVPFLVWPVSGAWACYPGGDPCCWLIAQVAKNRWSSSRRRLLIIKCSAFYPGLSNVILIRWQNGHYCSQNEGTDVSFLKVILCRMETSFEGNRRHKHVNQFKCYLQGVFLPWMRGFCWGRLLRVLWRACDKYLLSLFKEGVLCPCLTEYKRFCLNLKFWNLYSNHMCNYLIA